MGQFLNVYGDMSALVLTFLLSIIFTFIVKRKSGKKVRLIPSWLLLFGPAGILAFMFFHLLENSYRAVAGIIAGSFQYDFRFYSIILFGLVLMGAGYLFLRACLRKCSGEKSANKPIFFSILLVVFITAPLIPITPLSMLPMILSVISLLGLPFATRSRKEAAIVSLNDNAAALTV